MPDALTVFVALGLLVAVVPYLSLAGLVLLVGYFIWEAIRRRRGHLD